MQQWSFSFGPGGFVNPAEVEAQRRQQIQRLIDEKRCVVCQNTYLINDQITFCHFKNECVDNDYGKECEHWEPIKITN